MMAMYPTRLGWIYIKKNLSDSAISIFRDLVRDKPERSIYRYHFAMALHQKGTVASAGKSARRPYESKPIKG